MRIITLLDPTRIAYSQATDSKSAYQVAFPMNTDDRMEVVSCIGTFDNSGFPISTSKSFSDYATVTFQALSLNMLIARSMGLGAMKTSYVKHKNGSSIRIERNHNGFIAYLEQEARGQVIPLESNRIAS